jgi:chemotaxis family two-component system response regulator Rcp1
MELIDKLATVLVVEDNAADAELVVEGLQKASAATRVQVVESGMAALEYLRDPEHAQVGARPALVLLDLNLPQVGGLDTLAEIKADEQLRRIPVVVLTTSKSQREINRSYELGAAAVLNKPMRLAEHRAMMQAVEEFWLRHVRLPDEGH